jgi:exodeoxyribonuclease VII large subunit
MATIFSVTEFTRRVRDLLEGQLRDVWIEGEISNYRKQSSGHHYFTLKDDRAQLACVMFSRAYSAG